MAYIAYAFGVIWLIGAVWVALNGSADLALMVVCCGVVALALGSWAQSNERNRKTENMDPPDSQY